MKWIKIAIVVSMISLGCQELISAPQVVPLSVSGKELSPFEESVRKAEHEAFQRQSEENYHNPAADQLTRGRRVPRPRVTPIPISSDTIKSRELFPDDPEAGNLSRLLRSALVVVNDPARERDLMRRENEYYTQFQGKSIGNIYVYRNEIFDDESKWLERTANSLHILTKEKQIRRDLLIAPGDSIDPAQMMNNRRIIRNRPYIADVNILLVPTDADTTMVDVYVVTRDTWSINVGGGGHGDGKIYGDIFDDNILGWGNTLTLRTYVDSRDGFKYGGNLVQYGINNILGTFFNGRLVAGKGFDYSEFGVDLNKEFVRQRDYGAGLTIMRQSAPIDLYQVDTVKSIWFDADVWGGYSFHKPGWKKSLFTSARFHHRNYLGRPEVTAETNPYFHNEDILLAEVGLYRERFRATTRITGYGINEYVAYGYKVGLIGGMSWGEFDNNLYYGSNLSAGTFTKIGYIGAQFNLGSYFSPSTGKFFRSALSSQITYFTNLKGRGLYPVRQFVTLGLTRGWNRLSGYYEEIGINRDYQLRSLREKVYGENRLLLNTETVLFTPWQVYQFRFALYTFWDMGLIGNYGNIFRNDFYTSVGIGVRIKNEHLTFQTITLRLGIALGKHGFMDSRYFHFTMGDRVNTLRYLPQKPEMVEFW